MIDFIWYLFEVAALVSVGWIARGIYINQLGGK